MAGQDLTRKAQFRAALTLAGTTANRWASEHGVTGAHLHYVLAGARRSPRLEAAIDAFIREHMATLATTAKAA